MIFKENIMIKSPLNYIGGKYKLLEQILPLFPKKIKTFVDLFCGGCNVGINVNAENIIFNDNLTYLINLFKEINSNDIDYTFNHIENRIKEYNLSKTNEDGYKNFRNNYNQTKLSLDLFVLIAYSFNHQIRFNNNHDFNNPFGRNRSCFNDSMKLNLKKFTLALKDKNAKFQNFSFEKFDFSKLDKDDFVYCDPPYLITTGSYNDGRRGFKGWTKNEEFKLLEILDDLNKNGVRFALSNVLYHKGKENIILKEWLKDNKYNLSYLKKNYSNSNYQTKIREENGSLEILVSNYITPKPIQPKLFDL